MRYQLETYNENVNFQELGDWETSLQEYFLDLQAGLQSLDEFPTDEKDAHEIINLKREKCHPFWMALLFILYSLSMAQYRSKLIPLQGTRISGSVCAGEVKIVF
jgi:hypothetical protein